MQAHVRNIKITNFNFADDTIIIICTEGPGSQSILFIGLCL